MENLKSPYMLLSNHMHFIDFKLAFATEERYLRSQNRRIPERALSSGGKNRDGGRNAPDFAPNQSDHGTPRSP